MNNKIKWVGKYEIVVKKDGEVVKTEVIKNRVMNGALNALANAFLDTDPDLDINYLAVGTSSAALADNQTGLTTEVFRTAPSVVPTLTGTGEVATEFIILDSEAQVAIEELGIFAGSTCTTAAGTGTLLSRVLWSYDKTVTNIEIAVRRTDTLDRG
jgi:hypothetical protein